MKKKATAMLSLALVALMMVGTLAGCGGGSSSDSDTNSADPQQTYTFSYGCVGNEDEATFRAAKIWADYMEEKSEGRIKVELYPNGQLGNDRELQEAVQMGQLVSMGTGLTQQTNFVPELSVMDVPFAFSTAEDVANLFADETFWNYLSDLYAQRGFKLIGENFQGFRTMTANKAVRSVADCKGLSIRVIESPTPMAIWSAVGANPTPVSFTELYTALIYSMKFYEQQKYIINTNHQIQPILWVINLDFWNNLPEDLQQIVSDGMAEATAYANEVLAEEEAEMLKEMTDGGVEYIELTDESRQEFKDATASVWPMLQEQYPEFYDVFVSALERTQK